LCDFIKSLKLSFELYNYISEYQGEENEENWGRFVASKTGNSYLFS
jgi:hypothetical protein